MDAPKDRCAEAQRPALWTLGGGCLFAILVGVQCVQLWFNLHFPDCLFIAFSAARSAPTQPRDHSLSAGDLRELLRVPLRSQGYCGFGRGLSGLHWLWYNGRGPHFELMCSV